MKGTWKEFAHYGRRGKGWGLERLGGGSGKIKKGEKERRIRKKEGESQKEEKSGRESRKIMVRKRVRESTVPASFLSLPGSRLQIHHQKSL